MTCDYNLISADSHAIQPPDLWEKWLPQQFQDKAPKLIKDPRGGDQWEYPQTGTLEPMGLVTNLQTRPEELNWHGASYGDGGAYTIHPGCYQGKGRLGLLDIDGVDAEVMFPPQRAIMYFMQFEDIELQLAGIRAYNDWLSDGFCAADPERLVPLAQMPNAGVENNIAEMKRAKEMGHKGVIVTSWPSGGDFIRPEDDPFWAAAEELNMPVHLHLILVTRNVRRTEDTPAGVQDALGALGFANVAGLIAQLIFSGVNKRFPNLKFLTVESGAGWVPYFLEAIDDRWWRNRHRTGSVLTKKPSQYWFDNWLATFMVDHSGVFSRHLAGVKNIMWSTDFPHHGNDWPYSRKLIDSMMTGVPDEERHRMLALNCAELYGLGHGG